MHPYEYAPEEDVRGEILASAAGADDWEPWRIDATGTAWYRRRIHGVPKTPDAVFDDVEATDGDDEHTPEEWDELLEMERENEIAAEQRREFLENRPWLAYAEEGADDEFID